MVRILTPHQTRPASLPARLRQIREQLGLTRAGFARRLRVTRNSVSRYELGHQVPTVAVLVRIARAGGVSLDWLLAGEDPAAPRRARPDEWAATVAALRRVWTDPESAGGRQTRAFPVYPIRYARRVFRIDSP
jgi:transcriptional regulator with XRE-family HTH domain